MALKRKTLGAVKTLLTLDDAGFATGIVGELTQKEVTQTTKTSKGEMDEYKREVLVIPIFGTCNAVKPMNIQLMLGQTINPEYVDNVRVGTKNVAVYNRFTQLLLSTNIVSEDELKEGRTGAVVFNGERLDKVWTALENLEGEKIKFKAVVNKKGFYEIELKTVQIIKK